MPPMRNALRALILLPALLLSACNGGDDGEELFQPQPASVPLGREFDLRYGATAEVEGLALEFSRLVEESRCPASVTCVWQGNARIMVTAREGRTTSLLELNTNAAFPTSAVLGNYFIMLRDLQPYPATPTTMPTPEGYTATLVIDVRAVPSGG